MARKAARAAEFSPVTRDDAIGQCEAQGFTWRAVSPDMFEVLRIGPGRLCLGRFRDGEPGWRAAQETVAAHVHTHTPETVQATAPTETATLTPDLASGMAEIEVPVAEKAPREAVPQEAETDTPEATCDEQAEPTA